MCERERVLARCQADQIFLLLLLGDGAEDETRCACDMQDFSTWGSYTGLELLVCISFVKSGATLRGVEASPFFYLVGTYVVEASPPS